MILFSAWEDFGGKTNADAYDKNIRWMASRPWIQLVTPDQIASGQVDLSQPPDGAGDTWGVKDRSTGGGSAALKVAHDYVDHATQENYDSWYFGSAQEEALSTKQFSIRTGVLVPSAFGIVGTEGVAHAAWSAVAGFVPTPANIDLYALARSVLHAAQFETAFHDQTNNDLSKFSTGAYINPDTSFQSLASFSKTAQAQTRFAAVYARVNSWSSSAGQGLYLNSSQTAMEDVDLDGEAEYLVYNDRLFALFERIGGRMTGAWLRNLETGHVAQVVGNFASYAGSETELEGAGNFTGSAVNAHRTSAFKDWFAKTDPGGAGTSQYVNELYTVAPAPAGTGWKLTSADGKIAKTITLNPGANQLHANYATTGIVQLFVRFGLSPDLENPASGRPGFPQRSDQQRPGGQSV